MGPRFIHELTEDDVAADMTKTDRCSHGFNHLGMASVVGAGVEATTGLQVLFMMVSRRPCLKICST